MMIQVHTEHWKWKIRQTKQSLFIPESKTPSFVQTFGGKKKRQQQNTQTNQTKQTNNMEKKPKTNQTSIKKNQAPAKPKTRKGNYFYTIWTWY